MSIAGGCACGAVRYSGQVEPGFSFLCQCRSCQRSSGSGHLAQFVYPRTDFHVRGRTQSWTRQTDSGNTVTKFACATCLSPLWGAPSVAPDLVMIAAASLDDPTAFRPTKILYADEAAPWDCPAVPARARQ